ncbi:MAG TPA: hypothetical protein VMP03_04320, partial [Methylomirabilota bacterium]|nr:hypothetical protein [Methylomirabilota bacterium]
MLLLSALIVVAHAALPLAAPASPVPVNIIDGADERGSLLELGVSLGLSSAEIARIRSVSGHVVCADGAPVTASGALYLTNDQVLTAGHVFFDADGAR